MPDETLTDRARFSEPNVDSPALDALSDGKLLERFVCKREEAAFAALVRRHGPMVLAVCRRLLRHNTDAEDAFQATFLVLSQKAHRLRRPEVLANWLYGVAYRTALNARQRGARRMEREREAAQMSASNRNPDGQSQELQFILDEELHHLPEKYRAPLVLCYLEGKTNEEAAHMLGWPAGSISYRLARGRDLLRKRLELRMAGLTILLPTIFLAEYLQPAVVPTYLAKLTAQAATMLVSGKAAVAGTAYISASVRELMSASMNRQTPLRWSCLLVVLLFGLILFGIGVAVNIVTGGWPFADHC